MKKLTNILIVDTETTGLKTENSDVIEMGAILYNIPNKQILQQFSTLIPVKENLAYEVNQIKQESSEVEMPFVTTLDLIEDVAHLYSDAVFAHNVSFDKAFIKKLYSKYVAGGGIKILNMPWYCSCNEFDWPDHAIRSSRKLTNIAISLNVQVTLAHRALADCQILADSFSALPDLQDRMDELSLPKDLYVAQLPFEERGKAKAAGFFWDRLAPHMWAKYMTSEQAQKITFKIAKVEGI